MAMSACAKRHCWVWPSSGGARYRARRCPRSQMNRCLCAPRQHERLRPRARSAPRPSSCRRWGLWIGLLTGGDSLLEGVPGLAKTLAVRTGAECRRISFSRIQFTPDLLPADVIGTMVFDQRSQEFYPKKGPLFANLVLADEINR